MNDYGAISQFYDSMQDVNYTELAGYIDTLFKRFGIPGNKVLDVACGTGSLTLCLSRLGYDMIGSDQSEEMLSVARNKSSGSDGILWICQSMQELDLYGDIDCAVCTLDSVNHITNFNELCEGFSRVALFMNKGGLFVFDVNTPYKHEKVLGNNSFVFEENGVFCSWQNEYEPTEKIVDMQLDFFLEKGGLYSRKTQFITEKAYTHGEICKALSKSGFEFIACFGGMSEKPPVEDTERIFYIAKK